VEVGKVAEALARDLDLARVALDRHLHQVLDVHLLHIRPVPAPQGREGEKGSGGDAAIEQRSREGGQAVKGAS